MRVKDKTGIQFAREFMMETRYSRNNKLFFITFILLYYRCVDVDTEASERGRV